MDRVPHFTARTLTGDPVSYASLWQHRQLVLVTLPSGRGEGERYAREVREAFADATDDIALVLTRDEVPGIPAPGAVIADRWGEIIHAVRADSVERLPPAQELRDWAEHVRQRCPECEGEWR